MKLQTIDNEYTNRRNLIFKLMVLMKTSIFLFLFLQSTIVLSQSQTIDLERYGFSANWFESSNKFGSTIIIFGGSEGGSDFGDKWALKLNKMGYNILSMAYFGNGDLPKQLELIPLEYLDKAIEWLDSIHNKSDYKYGLIGVSKGAELALIQASRLDKFNAVVALAPSSVIWQSINRENYMSKQSSWTLEGKPLPFLPYCYTKGYQNIFNFYDCALDSINENAKIKVNNIKAPLLLISGGNDKLWPSERMANMIIEELTSVAYPYEFIHKNHPSAGHWLFAPIIPDDVSSFLERNNRMRSFKF